MDKEIARDEMVRSAAVQAAATFVGETGDKPHLNELFNLADEIVQYIKAAQPSRDSME